MEREQHMKTLPPGMQAHLESGATTLCWCWRVTRNDGVAFGFTDHDEGLTFAGTLFEAVTGFTGTEIAGAVGLNVDSLDVESVLKSDRLNEADLAAGLFDNAVVEIYRVNWAEPEQRILMRYGALGEVTRGRIGFRAEVRGLAHELQQPKGRLYQYGCDADLGDARCGVDLDDLAFRATGEVVGVVQQRTFIGSPLGGRPSGWFSRGLLTWTSGANEGRSMEVKSHTVDAGVVTIELWQLMAEPIAPGDEFSITAGCDKQFETCRTKFSNQLNFRGFPQMPGNDFAISYPNTDDGDNDGGSRR